MTSGTVKKAAWGAYVCLIAVIALWELALDPSRAVPPLFWFGIKEVPLLALLYGLFRGRVSTFSLASMLILVYLADGLMISVMLRRTAWSWHGGLAYGVLETLLSFLFFAAALAYVRIRKRQRPEAFPSNT